MRDTSFVLLALTAMLVLGGCRENTSWKPVPGGPIHKPTGHIILPPEVPEILAQRMQDKERNTCRRVDGAVLQEWMRGGRVLVYDCNTPEDRLRFAVLPGAAPADPATLDEAVLGKDKDVTRVFYGHRGEDPRAMQAITRAKGLGYTNCVLYDEGAEGWETRGGKAEAARRP